MPVGPDTVSMEVARALHVCHLISCVVNSFVTCKRSMYSSHLLLVVWRCRRAEFKELRPMIVCKNGTNVATNVDTTTCKSCLLNVVLICVWRK